MDRIPLVLYIPPPPGDDTTGPAKPLLSPTSYPPALPKQPPAAAKKKKRFIAFKPIHTRAPQPPRSVEDDVERGIVQHSIGAINTLALVNSWDAMWAPAPYPLVRLPENKATCMICLCEFEEPRKLADTDADAAPGAPHTGSDDGDGEAHEMASVPPLSPAAGQPPGTIEEVLVEPPREADAQTGEISHDEEGEDALQPLRLLSCGHAYHVSLFTQRRPGTDADAAVFCPVAEGVHRSVAHAEVGALPVLPDARRGAAAGEERAEVVAAQGVKERDARMPTSCCLDLLCCLGRSFAFAPWIMYFNGVY